MIEEHSFGIILFREPRSYLLLRYIGGHWDFIKGHQEPGEPGIDTARRECKEETGITELQFLAGFEEKIDYYYARPGGKFHKYVVFYLAKTSESEVKLSDEHTNFVWLPYEEAVKRATHANSKRVLIRAQEFLANA